MWLERCSSFWTQGFQAGKCLSWLCYIGTDAESMWLFLCMVFKFPIWTHFLRKNCINHLGSKITPNSFYFNNNSNWCSINLFGEILVGRQLHLGCQGFDVLWRDTSTSGEEVGTSSQTTNPGFHGWLSYQLSYTEHIVLRLEMCRMP